MTLTVESKDGKVAAYHNSKISKNEVFIDIAIGTSFIQPLTIKHSDIDSVIEVLQLYKARMTEVLGSDSLK